MARARFVRPEFFTSESMADLAFGARLLFIGLWTQADLRGVFEYRPRLIRSQVFPFDDGVTSDQVRAWLENLEAARCIVRFEADGKPWGYVCNWLKYQSVSKREKDISTRRPSPPSERVDPGDSPGSDTGTTQVLPRRVPLTPSPSPSPAEGVGTSQDDQPPPPISQEEAREASKRLLRRHGACATDVAAKEWGDLLCGRGGCQSREEALEGLRWILNTAKARSCRIEYARQAWELADEYAKRRNKENP